MLPALFARERAPGWDAWGDELGLFDSPNFAPTAPKRTAAPANGCTASINK
jgi:hypothetical protein